MGGSPFLSPLSKKLGHTANMYKVELKQKIPTSGLDSQLPLLQRHQCPSALAMCLLLCLANSTLSSKPTLTMKSS